ncbi:MAG: hypothetical protein LBN23_07880 [Paludibacter sp.]|jgi:hypothetical protein|nr:hypothetical protein [Paludibacter sp.]
MKKQFILGIALVAVFVFGFTSCSKDTEKCWEVTASVTLPIIGERSNTQYVWCTENELDAAKESVKTALGNYDGITVTSKKANKSQADCKK